MDKNFKIKFGFRVHFDSCPMYGHGTPPIVMRALADVVHCIALTANLSLLFNSKLETWKWAPCSRRK